uniref:DUF5824 domain-containing protein n=1 Tax=viral metagenome TaxID=1070528 RepID=A0A6C0CWS6_9ZZZZ
MSTDQNNQNTQAIIISSHQNRIQSLISYLKETDKVYKLDNGAVVLISIPKNKEMFKVSIVYYGDPSSSNLNEKKPEEFSYYTDKGNELEFIQNKDFLNTGINSILGDGIFLKNIFNKGIEYFNIYIIRHGECDHNLRTYLIHSLSAIYPTKRFYDSKLNNNGKKQIVNLGNSDTLNIIGEVKSLFCSDLRRTHQTMKYFLDSYNKNENNSSKQINVCDNKCGLNLIYVLPGNDEIDEDYRKKSKYPEDGFTDGLKLQTAENRTITDYDSLDDNNRSYNDNIVVDWTYYKLLYQKYPRSSMRSPIYSFKQVDFLLYALKIFMIQNVQPSNTLEDTTSVLSSNIQPSNTLEDSTEVVSSGGSKKGGSKYKKKIKTHKKPTKVNVTYKNKTKSIPKKYIAGLKGKEKKAQIKSIFEQTDRPKTSAKEKRSKWIIKFEKKYNKKITDTSWINKNIISVYGQNKILNKGRGAYYSSGSRPNQTPDSWAYARLASVIMDGPSRKYDINIWNKHKVNK